NGTSSPVRSANVVTGPPSRKRWRIPGSAGPGSCTEFVAFIARKGENMAKSRKPEPPPAESGPPQATGTTTLTSPIEAGNGEQQLPVFRVGPIPTDANSTVGCMVWEDEARTGDGRTFKVHTVLIEARHRDAEGQWKPTRGFRGSQLYALLYCVQKAS